MWKIVVEIVDLSLVVGRLLFVDVVLLLIVLRIVDTCKERSD